jgi:hypothetical protein
MFLLHKYLNHVLMECGIYCYIEAIQKLNEHNKIFIVLLKHCQLRRSERV